MSHYNADGSTNLTVVSGSSWTGLYAADGSWNIVLNNGTSWIGGIYNPCGAFNATQIQALTNRPYSSNGSLNVYQDSLGNYHPVSSSGYGVVTTTTSSGIRADTTRITADITGVLVDRTSIVVDSTTFTADMSAMSADYSR